MPLIYKIDTNKSQKNKKGFFKLKSLVSKDLVKVNNLIEKRLNNKTYVMPGFCKIM